MDELNLPSEQLRPVLNQVRWRMRLRDGLLLAQQTLWLAGLVAALTLLAGRIWPIEQPWKWALIAPAAWLLVVLAYSLYRPQTDMHVARRADAELGLKERLSTSLALDSIRAGHSTSEHALLASFEPHLVERAHADALRAAGAIQPARDFPLEWLPRPLGLAAGLLLACLLMLWLPNPMDSLIAERKQVAEEAKRQAEQIDKLRQQIENAKEMTPEEREALRKKLDELAQQLRNNPGSREQAMADLSKLEEALRPKLDPKGGQRQAALEAMAAQLQALAKEQNPQIGDLKAAEEALQKLAEQMQQMTPEERQALAQQLAQMAARAAQAGDGSLAQALASLAQAAQSGDAQQVQDAAKKAAEAMKQAQSDLANQKAFSQTLSQLQNSRQAMSRAGQSSQRAQQGNQGQGQGQNQGQGQGQSQGQSQGQGQGQGQGQNAGGGGGTNASSLPPANRKGRAGSPQGPGKDTGVGDSNKVYAPRTQPNASNGSQVFIPGQDTNQGETSTKEQKDPLAGANNPALVPYNEVYQTYLDTANQAMDQSYIPPGMKDYIKQYFSQLEP